MTKESSLPQGIRIGEEHHTFVSVHQVFSRSAYGETLRRNSRFGLFKPAEIHNKDWERALGSDVNNLNHLAQSLHLTKRFLSYCDRATDVAVLHEDAVFEPSEKEQLLFTATVHDWGEAIVGDIPLPHKTEEDEAKEMVILGHIIHELLGKNETKEELSQTITTVQSILTDKSTKLGRAFNAIELVGYVRTGLRAWSEAPQSEEPLTSSLFDLAIQVVPNNLKQLLKYAEIYPPVNSYLSHHRERITHIISENPKYDSTHPWFTNFLPQHQF